MIVAKFVVRPLTAILLSNGSIGFNAPLIVIVSPGDMVPVKSTCVYPPLVILPVKAPEGMSVIVYAPLLSVRAVLTKFEESVTDVDADGRARFVDASMTVPVMFPLLIRVT